MYAIIAEKIARSTLIGMLKHTFGKTWRSVITVDMIRLGHQSFAACNPITETATPNPSKSIPAENQNVNSGKCFNDHHGSLWALWY